MQYILYANGRPQLQIPSIELDLYDLNCYQIISILWEDIQRHEERIQRTFRLLHFVVQWVLADSRMIMKIIEQSVMPHVLLIVMKNYLLFTLVMYFIYAEGYIIGQKKSHRTSAKNVA